MNTDVVGLTVSDLTRLLVDASDKETLEFNTLFDQLEESNNLAAKLQKDIVNYKEIEDKFNILEQQCETIYSNGDKHLNAAKQAYRERDQMQDKLNTANELLKSYKNIDTPKKIREKYKTYQTKIAADLVSLNKSKDLIKDYRKEISKHIDTVNEMRINETKTNMTSMWSEDGDSLMLFPARLTMKIGNAVEQQLTLLYMTPSGCGKLIAIDEDGRPVECTVPEEGLNPKARTLEVAGELLRKWRRNGWKLDLSDLDLGSK